MPRLPKDFPSGKPAKKRSRRPSRSKRTNRAVPPSPALVRRGHIRTGPPKARLRSRTATWSLVAVAGAKTAELDLFDERREDGEEQHGKDLDMPSKAAREGEADQH